MNTATQETEADVIMDGDVVIREVHRVKEELAREHGFDIQRIGRDLQSRQYLSGHRVVSRAKKDYATAKTP